MMSRNKLKSAPIAAAAGRDVQGREVLGKPTSPKLAYPFGSFDASGCGVEASKPMEARHRI